MIAYQNIIAATDVDRRDLFVTAAQRFGTTVQNIEKDFWVCWTLDALFHRLTADGPRLLFKGGTSLSKGYNLISRFSEDIDVTVFRADIGEAASVEDLEQLSKTKRRQRLDNIKSACQTYINDTLQVELNAYAKQAMAAAGKDPAKLHIIPDPDDDDKQSLLIYYPSIVETPGYVEPFVKIESGAKSALDPHETRTIVPYLAGDVRDGDALNVPGVITIDPERTFLDKILILHGLPIFFGIHGRLYGNGQMSRHYYDVHRMMDGAVGKKACTDEALIESCVRHARMFFHRKDTGLEYVKRGSFQLKPSEAMLDTLRRDYAAMATMIFGEVPTFEAVLESVADAEERLNAI